MQKDYWRQDHNFLSPWTCLNCTVKESISPWIFPHSQTPQGRGLRNSRGFLPLENYSLHKDLVCEMPEHETSGTLFQVKCKPKYALGKMCPMSSLNHVSHVKLHFKLRLGSISGVGLRGRRFHFLSALQRRMHSIFCCLYKSCGSGATERALALSQNHAMD